MTFEEFLDTELDALSRYARGLCGNRDDAQDLVADVLLAAVKRWEKISQLSSPMPYVRRMITNRHLDHARRKRALNRAILLSLPTASTTPTEAGTRVVEQRQFLDALLRELPARQRAAVVLRFFFALSDDEIGDELGMTASSARSARSRAMATLRTKTTIDNVRTHYE